jgi:Na+/H+ antiporter NhaC
MFLVNFLLIFIIFVVFIQIDYDKQNSKQNSKQNKQNEQNEQENNLINLNKYLQYILVCTLVVGFFMYYNKQYNDHKKNFSVVTFLLGTSSCSSIK